MAGIIAAIVLLSFIFPSDPSKPDIITRLKGTKININTETVKNYRIGDIVPIDSSGSVLIWSLDENYIYYTKPAKEGENDGSEELWVSNLHGKKQKINSKYKFYNIRDARLSPDGTMLCFISTTGDSNELFLYDINKKTIINITPGKVSDVGVTSYDWDDESLYIIMSVDIVRPRIELYNVMSQKFIKLDMKLRACRDVAFYKGDNIIFSDKDEDSKYKIFTADRTGKGIKPVTEGEDFILSPNRENIAILSDGNSQSGLWVYNMTTGNSRVVSSESIYNAFWLTNSVNLLYSTEQDCKSRYTYGSFIYYLEGDFKKTEISGAIHTIFVPSNSGSKIAMTSPDYMEDKNENKGVFVGQIYK